MDFSEWLEVNGFDAASLSDAQKRTLSAAWRAESNGGTATATPPMIADSNVHLQRHGKDDDEPYEKKLKAIEAEAERVNFIRETGFQAMEEAGRVGNRAKVEQIRELMDTACKDTAVSQKDWQLTLIRLGRATVGNPIHSEPQADARVVEAAVCRQAGLENLEKHFPANVLEASEQRYKRGLSLVGLLDESAKRNGWRGRVDVQSKDFLRAAFGMTGDGGILDIRAGTTGPSTYSLPNIVGNIANKFLKSGWLSVDGTWSMLTYKRSVNDFKTITTARLNGALIYRTLAPGGEIKHGTLTESTFTNRASTYAIMLGISREDLINDDIGAFTELSRHMGRGAGLKINDLFWTVFLNNSAFFTSGNANVSTGGGSALGTADGAAINAAEVKFVNQTDPNGYPVALAPKILLAPPTLANTARRWMGSFGMVQSGTAGLGDTNIFQGRYSVLTSPYMENTSYTGNSTAAWYLLADPNDEAVVEGVALNGRWEPTVDTAEPDFNQLGMAMRGYVDVGFAFKEPRAGVRSAGS